MLPFLFSRLVFRMRTRETRRADVKEQPCGVKPYMAVRGGLAMIKDHIDKNAWDASLAVGTKMDAFRIEGEYTYRGEVKGHHAGLERKIGAQTLLLNGYYDIDLNSAFTPFFLSADISDALSSATHFPLYVSSKCP